MCDESAIEKPKRAYGASGGKSGARRQHLNCTASFNCHNDPVRQVLLLLHFIDGKAEVREVMQLTHGHEAMAKSGFEPRVYLL